MMPILNSRNIPNSAKVGLCLVLGLILLPVIKIDQAAFPVNVFSSTVLLVKELFVGFTLGLVMKFVFTAVQIAGQMLGFQMGFGVANVMDPQLGQETPILSELGYLVSLLIFLGINGHHIFFKILVYSFETIQPGQISLTQATYEKVLVASGGMFLGAVKIMAPVTAILLFTQVALGILAKAVPQMNLLTVSFPVTICTGLFFFGLSMQVMGPFFIRMVENAADSLVLVLRTFRG